MFKLCKIIAPSEEDRLILNQHLRRYPLEISNNINELNELDDKLDANIDEALNVIPTLVIGWANIKQKFPEQNIFTKQIDSQTSWTYSKEEDEDVFLKEVEEFINKCLKMWLPSKFTLYDSIFSDKKLSHFLEKEINNSHKTYVYFYKNAMYLNNNDKNFIVNIKNIWLTDVEFKNIITDFLNNTDCFCFSYKNIAPFVDFKKIKCLYTFNNIRWVKYGQNTKENYFQIIPGFDIGKYAPFIMSNVSNFTLNDEEKTSLDRACKRDIITEWLSERYICFDPKFFNSSLNFIYRDNIKLAKINYSNKKTLTGRITTEGSYSLQNLQKNNNERTDIISRFAGGKIVVFDYTSFEARIALYYCEDDEFISENYQKDLHFEVGKTIFQTTYIRDDQRDFAKILTHSIMYSASKGTVLDKLKNFPNREWIHEQIKVYLKPILIKSAEIKKFNDDYGYIINKWGSIIRPKKEKNYASFSNYISSNATEILVDKLYEIKDFLEPYKSEFIFQVHDSVVFDIHPQEKDILKDLIKILTNYKGMKYGISYRTGVNFKDLSKEYYIF